jgi:type I restriction-modification system DNA methylase subunit
MSEELIQRNYTEHGMTFGRYEYYNLGSTNIRTLRAFNIIPNKSYEGVLRKKPDGLLVDRNELNNVKVVAVFEYKAPNEFDTPEKKTAALKQCCIDYCKPMGAKVAIVTDGNDYLWANPQLPNNDFEIIIREDGYPLHLPFEWSSDEEITQSLEIIEKVISDISQSNSSLLPERLINPSKLADRVWQTIWLASGENPDACLATFVEIFVYKYLSDLGIITYNEAGLPISFADTLAIERNRCLVFYFSNVRTFIKQIFPPDPNDGTSIINGTVLNPEISEHNLLFYKILEEFNSFGVLTNIDPEFKSRLYEHFLKKSISQKNWGQFFTPRNIIKAIVEMSEIERLSDGAKVSDPACGVGGFVLEPYITKRSKDYFFDDGQLKSRLDYSGYDRDQKTIILAKANMLIHINELLGTHPESTLAFSSVINRTFNSIHKSVLGSLSLTPIDEYDLIMTNPPYVMTGTSKYKEFIQENGALSNFYSVNALGVEGLFVEKIIRSLKPGGKAFIIVPDGILNRLADKKIRKFILDSCILEGVISLPKNTFYTTPKKTYILALTKKTDQTVTQSDSVFSYVVVNTGETLDANRFTCDNDLPEMVRLYKYFRADKNAFESPTIKCKSWSVSNFVPESHWSVDRWLTEEERISIGISEEKDVKTISEFVDVLLEEKEGLENSINTLSELSSDLPSIEETVEIELGDTRYFETFIGKRVLVKDLYYGPSDATIPVYSANVNQPMGWMTDSNIEDFNNDFVLWGIDGNFEFNILERGTPFRTTDHCGAIRILDPKIDPGYLFYFLSNLNAEESLDRELRANLTNMRRIKIRIPVKQDENGNYLFRKINPDLDNLPENLNYDFDLEKQKHIANYALTISQIKEKLTKGMETCSAIEVFPLE